eukprot:jgi/Bigna1/134498/aug1.25_g9206
MKEKEAASVPMMEVDNGETKSFPLKINEIESQPESTPVSKSQGSGGGGNLGEVSNPRKRKRRLDLLRPAKISLPPVSSSTETKSPLLSLGSLRSDEIGCVLELEGPRDLKDNVVKIRKIGNGTTSAVYLALHTSTMRLIAVKVRAMEDEQADSLIQELHELHENLVPIDEHGAPQWIFNHHKSVGTVHPCNNILSYYGAFPDRDAGTVNICIE